MFYDLGMHGARAAREKRLPGAAVGTSRAARRCGARWGSAPGKRCRRTW